MKRIKLPNRFFAKLEKYHTPIVTLTLTAVFGVIAVVSALLIEDRRALIATVVAVVVAYAVLMDIYLFFIGRRKGRQIMRFEAAMRIFKRSTFEYDVMRKDLVLNDGAKAIFGTDLSEWISLESFLYECDIESDSVADAAEAIKRLGIDDEYTFEAYCGKTEKHIRINVSKIVENRGRFQSEQFIVGIIEDVTEAARRQHELETQAKSDSLTRLWNREAMAQMITHELETNKNARHALILLDLDGFKQINDKYGHYVGDVLLQKVAGRLLVIEKNGDYTVGRMGGDEFCVFARNMETTRKVEELAKMVCRSLSSITIADSIDYYVCCSCGMAIYPRNGSTFNELYQCADSALYTSKENIGSYYTIYSNLSLEAKSENAEKHDQELVEDNFSLLLAQGEEGMRLLTGILKDAMAKEEIKVYFQPKISSTGKKPLGAEALSRWSSPIYGMIMPNKFIPLFEKTKLIPELDYYVLGQCIKLQSRSTASFSINVNQSLMTLTQPYYLNEVNKHIQRYGLKSDSITVEITERGIFTSMRTISKVIQQLHSLGIRVSIDDFGTGYTTLSILKDFDINEIKLDKSFVDIKGGTGAARAKIIIKEVCEMAKALGVETVAEGVETYQQAEYLSDVGCDYLQGFYFSRAVPYEEFLKSKDKFIFTKIAD